MVSNTQYLHYNICKKTQIQGKYKYMLAQSNFVYRR